jgi:hypothetical protein
VEKNSIERRICMPTINLGRVRGNDGDTNVDTVVEYTEPSSYVEPASGDTIRTLLSKIAKGLSDLFNNKIDKANIANNLATNQEGFVLDARMGKQLNDALTKVDIIDQIVFQTGFTSQNVQAYYFPALRKVEIRGRINGTFPSGATTVYANMKPTYRPGAGRWFSFSSYTYQGHSAIGAEDGTMNVTITSSVAVTAIHDLNISYYI